MHARSTAARTAEAVRYALTERAVLVSDPDLDPVRCSQVDPAVKQYPDETSVQHVLAGVSEAEPFPDIGPAISALHEAGIKVPFGTVILTFNASINPTLNPTSLGGGAFC